MEAKSGLHTRFDENSRQKEDRNWKHAGIKKDVSYHVQVK
jgi:hypothetical protein